MTIVPQVTNQSALDNNHCEACHQVDDRCHQVERVNYAMIAAGQDNEEHFSRN
jgi:hypothetical protein